MDKLEKVQIRAIEMIQGYKALSHEERLKRRGQTILEKRRSREDLSKPIRLLGLLEMKHYSWRGSFKIASSKVTRGHMYKLFKKPKETLGQKCFS